MRCKKRSNEKTVIATGARKTAALLLCCTIALFFLFSAFAAHATEVVGKFSAVEGRVEVMRDGKFPAAIASIGTTISANDLIKTKSDSKAEIVFYDGNILRIAQRSRIDISEYATGGKAVISMHDGKAEAIVPKQIAKFIVASPGANKFEIRTISAVGGVRGTDFFASYDGNVSEFTVKEGKVAVYNPQFPDAIVLITAGNFTVVEPHKPPLAPKPAAPENLKQYEKDVLPKKKEGSNSESKASLSEVSLLRDELRRFIGCRRR